MQPSRRVLLNDEGSPALARDFSFRFASDPEPALGVIGFQQRHGSSRQLAGRTGPAQPKSRGAFFIWSVPCLLRAFSRRRNDGTTRCRPCWRHLPE
jgi:hypothetical protein